MRCGILDGKGLSVLLARVRVESELRAAVAGGELAVLFQPVVDLVTGRTVKAEALLRWTHPELGAVPADGDLKRAMLGTE